ncbi:hypothetical protein MTO96_050200 [Rhipicephalus appendiculatus]
MLLQTAGIADEVFVRRPSINVLRLQNLRKTWKSGDQKHAAVDGHSNARDEGGIVGCQKGNAACHLFRLADTSECMRRAGQFLHHLHG